ncbi:MAG: carboxypeptidase regulatory-like domain-containing protein [Acidobacteriota bacterium]|nr:carboxypeptidase regulatory-like domain-containing protein [Acidobacteriota bacterium]
MRPVSRLLSLVFLVLLACPIPALAQTRPPELTRDTRPRNCSISGRVTINGQPAANVQVQFLEFPTESNAPQPIRQTADGSISRNKHKARTDSEGRYQISNLPPGRFVVTAASQAFVMATANPQNNESKMVTLDAGESRDNVDFALVRGGVITGQITDAEGRPVIAHHVRLSHVIVGPDGQTYLQNRGGLFNSQITDDRGVYRIYGIPAGNYAISAGGESGYFGGNKYSQTFYPDTPDEKQAKTIPVKSGEEVTGINLRLGAKRKTYEAAGRIIESDSGKPVPNIRVSCQKIYEEGSEDHEGGYGEGQADQQGNFRLTGLNRGKYSCRVRAGWMEATDFYAEPTTFQVQDEDVSGIEIKALRGGTISGVSIIEGSNDVATKAKLSRIMIYANAEPEERQDRTQPSSHHQTTIKPDGTFLLTGVAPGKVTLHVNSLGDRSMSLIRIEQGGAPIEESFKLAKGEKITDVRLIFAAGTGAIRGQVQPTSRPQTVGETYRIQARLQGNKTGVWFNNLVDEKGRFELSSLPAGEYELQLNGVVQLPDGSRRMMLLAKQKISVPAGSTVTVTIPYDPNRPFQEER